jgi:hypothetical protein
VRPFEQTLLSAQACSPLLLVHLKKVGSRSHHACVLCAAADEGTDAAVYGVGGFGGLMPGPSHSAVFSGVTTGPCPSGRHQQEASNEELQQAQLHAEQQSYSHSAAHGQAHMHHLVHAAAAQATHHQLAQQLAGHGMLTGPAQQGPQRNSCLPGSGQASQQAGLDLWAAAAQPRAGWDSGGQLGRRQVKAAATPNSDMNWESANTPGTCARLM